MQARPIRTTMAGAALGAAMLLGNAAPVHAGFTCGSPRPPGDVVFQHPKKSGKIALGLVQAFRGCGATPLMSEGGIPACAMQTPNEVGGSPATGWHWGEKGTGTIEIAPVCPEAADLDVRLRLSGVVDGNGAPASGMGTLRLRVVATTDDPVGGSMTTVSFPMAITFGLSSGAINFRTSSTAMLAASGLPPLPNTTSLELRTDPFDLQAGAIEIDDPNGNGFARVGMATTGKPAESCDVPHPGKSKGGKIGLVQAYFPCDPMYANKTTEGGIAACGPPETFHELNGSPSDGVTWDPQDSAGSVQLKPLKKPACVTIGTRLLDPACPGGLNPVDDTSDMRVTLKLKGLEMHFGEPANGDASLLIALRTTIHDRDNGAMTLTDGAVSFPITITNGKANVKTSLDAGLNYIGQPGLPPCASTEIAGVFVYDQNNDMFASDGAWLP